jgi:hypothetical protein
VNIMQTCMRHIMAVTASNSSSSSTYPRLRSLFATSPTAKAAAARAPTMLKPPNWRWVRTGSMLGCSVGIKTVTSAVWAVFTVSSCTALFATASTHCERLLWQMYAGPEARRCWVRECRASMAICCACLMSTRGDSFAWSIRYSVLKQNRSCDIHVLWLKTSLGRHRPQRQPDETGRKVKKMLTPLMCKLPFATLCMLCTLMVASSIQTDL